MLKASNNHFGEGSKLKKGFILVIFILDLSPEWLLDAFNIHVIYFEQKRFIFILIFFWIFY